MESSIGGRELKKELDGVPTGAAYFSLYRYRPIHQGSFIPRDVLRIQPPCNIQMSRFPHASPPEVTCVRIYPFFLNNISELIKRGAEFITVQTPKVLTRGDADHFVTYLQFQIHVCF